MLISLKSITSVPRLLAEIVRLNLIFFSKYGYFLTISNFKKNQVFSPRILATERTVIEEIRDDV